MAVVEGRQMMIDHLNSCLDEVSFCLLFIPRADCYGYRR
ncbi:hypothetical protein CHCC14814_4350 [Bacillus paralicheniformis]|nr:hypothetical protein CHCC14814_4350 [Bacillus paralicheniformis]